MKVSLTLLEASHPSQLVVNLDGVEPQKTGFWEGTLLLSSIQGGRILFKWGLCSHYADFHSLLFS